MANNRHRRVKKIRYQMAYKKRKDVTRVFVAMCEAANKAMDVAKKAIVEMSKAIEKGGNQ